MKPTITTSASPRPVTDPDGLVYWQVQEAAPMLRELRDFACQREERKASLITAATGVLTVIFEETLPFEPSPLASGAWSVDALILGRATAGGAARARYHIAGLFYREAGGAMTQEGATTTIVSIESVAAFNAAFAVTGNKIQVKVLDDGLHTVSWSAIVQIAEVL